MKRSVLVLIFSLFASVVAPSFADEPATRPAPPATGPASATTGPALPTTRPDPAIDRAMIISIDGLRPDLALRANTPTLHAMLDQGSFTFWAYTTAFAITLPSHTSMLTGVPPTKHLIEWNSDLPLIHPVYPAYPTVFELAHKAGYTTAMAAGKSKFINLDKPGTIDWVFLPPSITTEDDVVTAAATQMIAQHHPQVMFVHLPSVDNSGHKFGWATPEQMQAIANADTCVAKILDALKTAGVFDHTLIIVTADHGGAGLSHGPDDPRSRHIPWIAIGPGLKQGFDLTRIAELNVHTEDTFATVCAFLGIPVVRHVDGVPVMQILPDRELMGN
jgi:predicted AlkP superfamily pyrophosphatase or phosphodiesterase